MEIIQTTLAEISSIVPERKVTAAMKIIEPPATDRNYKLNETAFIFDEQTRE